MSMRKCKNTDVVVEIVLLFVCCAVFLSQIVWQLESLQLIQVLYLLEALLQRHKTILNLPSRT